MRKNMVPAGMSYEEMNRVAARAPIGSRGISVIPFGNGAERVLENRDPGSSFHGINFNIHELSDLLRAAQEGIVFSFQHGMEIMQGMGMDTRVIRAGNANMFLSPIFRETLASVSGARIELYDTDGAAGAAKAAGIGAGIYASTNEAFSSLEKIMTVEPDTKNEGQYQQAYQRWKSLIE
jgi:xylulokinase